MRVFILYLKIFFLMGITFGIGVGIIFWVFYGLATALWAGPFGGLFFGFFMSLYIVPHHIAAVRSLPYELFEDAINVCHKRKIIIPLPYDRAFDLCKESLKSIERCQIILEDRAQRKIIAKAPSLTLTRYKGVFSSGWEKIISFKIKKLSDESTEAEVSSKPRYPLALIDYGENLQAVETIARFLKESSESESKKLAGIIYPSRKVISFNFVGFVISEIGHLFLMEIVMSVIVAGFVAWLLFFKMGYLPLTVKLSVVGLGLLRIPLFYFVIKPLLGWFKGYALTFIYIAYIIFSYSLWAAISTALILGGAGGYIGDFFIPEIKLAPKTVIVGEYQYQLLSPEWLTPMPKTEEKITIIPSRKGIEHIFVNNTKLSAPITYTGSPECSVFGAQKFLEVYALSLSQNFSVCRKKIGPDVIQLIMEVGIKDDDAHGVTIFATKKYLQTQEGIDKIKQIFESFTILK